jgi:hypothetical protein
MSEARRIRIASDEQGVAHVYIVGTDIELDNVKSCNITVKPGNVCVAQVEIWDPDVEIKPLAP